MDLLTIIFRTGAVSCLGFGIYFAVKKRFWFPAYPLMVLAVVFAGAAKKAWGQLPAKVIPLLALYVIWTAVMIYLKKLKKKKDKE